MSEHRRVATLDPKHKKFCDEYLRTNRKGASARAAGYSPNSSHTEASRLLKRPDVQQYLAYRVAELTAKEDAVETQAKDTLDNRIINELETLAFANISDFITIDENGKPQIDFSGATPEQLKAIASVKSKTSRKFNSKGEHIATDQESAFTLADKYRGLELLAKHRGLFKAEEHKITLDVADRLIAARRRALLLGSDDIVDAS